MINSFRFSGLFVFLALRHIDQSRMQDMLLLVVVAPAIDSRVAIVGLLRRRGLAVATKVPLGAFFLLFMAQLMLFPASRPVLGMGDVLFHLFA